MECQRAIDYFRSDTHKERSVRTIFHYHITSQFRNIGSYHCITARSGVDGYGALGHVIPTS